MTTCDAIGPRRRSSRIDQLSVGASVLAGLLLCAPAAIAQPRSGDPAAAEALFQEARKLVKSGDYAAGCPKFEASLALYPSAGTMLNIADCREHEGKIAAAWEAYHQALALSRETQGAQRRSSLEKAAQEGIRAIEPRLPRLLIAVPRPPADLEVLRDGEKLPATALGEALPANPGTHQIRVSAPGYRTETRSVSLVEGKTATLEIPLSPDGSALAPKSNEGGVPPWVWITGGAGIALTGAGIFFLADHLSAVSALDENCPTNATGTRCTPGYDYESDNARKNRGLGLFLGLGGTGVIALGAATVGLVVSSSSSSKERSSKASSATASAWVAPGGAGAVLAGRF